MRSKHNCFRCVVQLEDNIIHDKKYKTLQEISDELGLSYGMVADFSSGRKKHNKYNNFKYFPQVKIDRIKKEEISDE